MRILKWIASLFTMSELDKYNIAASWMQMEGYTELDIINELGLPPKE